MNRGIAVAPRSGASIEMAAAWARGVLLADVPLLGPIDAVEFFERRLEDRGAALTGGIDVISAVITLPPSIEGNTDWLPEQRAFQVQLSDESYGNLERGRGRARFTLFHETGHLAVHRDPLQVLKRLPERKLMMARDESSHPVYCDSEWQADAFAAAFGMPAPALEELRMSGSLTVANVSEAFGMSGPAADLRIRKFKNQRAELLSAWRRGGWGGAM